MRSQLIIIHRSRALSEDHAFDLPAPWVVWETCLRRIALSWQSESHVPVADGTVYCGLEASRFLLEVVCGLLSPVKGETEVHGQFRDFIQTLGESHSLFKILQSIHLDARKIRTAHLHGLGSQSYGSLARKKMRRQKAVHIVGAGQLTREILPWLAKIQVPIHVYVREPERHLDLKEKYQNLSVLSLHERRPDGGALLIAAPINDGHLLDWLRSIEVFDLVLDYRAESTKNLGGKLRNYFGLQDIFREIESNKNKINGEVESAKALIRALCA